MTGCVKEKQELLRVRGMREEQRSLHTELFERKMLLKMGSNSLGPLADCSESKSWMLWETTN